MLRIVVFLPDREGSHLLIRECACCGGRYPVRRRGMRLLSGDSPEGDVCPDCVLSGPAGAAAKIRERLAASRNSGGEGGTSWILLLSRRARLLEETPSFSLAARQAAVRETRERR